MIYDEQTLRLVIETTPEQVGPAAVCVLMFTQLNDQENRCRVAMMQMHQSEDAVRPDPKLPVSANSSIAPYFPFLPPRFGFP